MTKKKYSGSGKYAPNSISVYYDIYKSQHNWIDHVIPERDFDKADAIILPGGSDWNPFWYNDFLGSNTFFNNSIDIEQMSLIIKALKQGKFIIGICRGHQGLHIAAGGKLFQHVSNHRASNHDIVDTFSKDRIRVNSLHHQMVNLFSLDKSKFDMIAYAEGLSTTYLNGDNIECTDSSDYSRLIDYKMVKEPEVVYYNEINGLGFQYHPEMMDYGNPALEYTNKIIEEVFWTRYERKPAPEYIIKRLKGLLNRIKNESPAPRRQSDLFSFVRDKPKSTTSEILELPSTVSKLPETTSNIHSFKTTNNENRFCDLQEL